MWEITVESKTRVIECGRAVLYERKYCGLQEENGEIRLLLYFGKRMPLAEAQLMELPKPENNMKDAA